jgi:PAS domain S-box-containing protein
MLSRREPGAWAFERGQRDVLEHIAGGAALPRLLTEITQLIETQQAGMLCSILLLDKEHGRVRHGAAPSLPAEFVRVIDGAKIGPQAGSCGTAAYLGERVIVEDIETHPVWVDYRDLARSFGLRACWSSPIFSSGRDVLGTFAMYFRERRAPEPQELEWVERATHLAAVAIERERTVSSLRTIVQLREIVFDGISDSLFLLDVEGDDAFRFGCANAAFLRATGLAEADVVGRLLTEVIPEASRAHALASYQTCARERRTVTWDEVSVYPAGTRYGEVSISPVFDAEGACVSILGTVHDITERKLAEERIRAQERALLQAQRLESLGRLAGGIAHDFNNILAAILANASLGKLELPPGHVAHDALSEIEQAGARATSLVRQILTFSRDEAPKREVVDVAAVAEEALRLLRVTKPRGVEIEAHLALDVPRILADSTHVHQVVMNLCSNALHATSDCGGRVSLRLERVTLHQPLIDGTSELEAGAYARVTVEDTGSGIDEVTLERIFEPFFTTKAQGKGTGLGLSVVHGIVKSHRGGIVVRSVPGRGSVFSVYFPALA